MASTDRQAHNPAEPWPRVQTPPYDVRIGRRDSRHDGADR